MVGNNPNHHQRKLYTRKVRETESPFAYLEFNIEEEDLVRFKKSFKGVVEDPNMTCNIQEAFNTERYFTIKVTPFGENLCVTKEREEGKLKVLVVEARDWLGKWFSHKGMEGGGCR